MANNLAVKATQLSDFLMTEEEMLRSQTTREHLFEVKDSHEISLGFAEVSSLKNYIYEYEEDSAGLMIRNVEAFDWMTVFEHPLFQRRRPQLVSTATLQADDDQQFFILKHGQKTGPYEKFEMLSM